MKAQCDPTFGVNAKALFDELQSKVAKSITLPEDYSYKVFGEQENQVESNEALAKYMPLALLLIFTTLLLLFRNYRDPIVILAMIPLIFVGVVLGLAVLGKSFNFFSLLGLLGLVGMNIKNAVILVDKIGEERRRKVGRDVDAVMRAVRSRVLPVTLASGTTILGMLPLLPDSMFGGMAATIMGGLLVATFLTIFVLPVTYSLFYGVKVDD
jgi:multidrug efflux pump subunit AcrB